MEAKQCSVTISNKLGLHARASAKFVRLAESFNATISVTKDQQTVNAKNIIEVMLLAATYGTVLELRAVGKDAALALAALSKLVAQGFDELE